MNSPDAWKAIDPAMRELVITTLLDVAESFRELANQAGQRGLPIRSERMRKTARAHTAAAVALGWDLAANRARVEMLEEIDSVLFPVWQGGRQATIEWLVAMALEQEAPGDG